MKGLRVKPIVATVLVTATISLTIHLPEAKAYRGGFSGGSFRAGGEYAEGPRGGELAEGPRGGEAVEGPGGDAAVRGPEGNVVVGSRTTTLPAGANTVVVSGQTYYVAGGVYYQPYYAGSEVTYVVVDAPDDSSDDTP